MKTICLNMIVKNESAVIQRCLDSVKPIIDSWVIVDTGSTDGTQEVIRNCLKNIPGELFERPWIDFAHNRNEALDRARNKADYFLFIDADERLVFSETFDKSRLNKDYYLARMIGKNVDFRRILLIKNDPEWKWEGVLHEFITNPNPIHGEILSGVINEYNHVAGCRSRDAEKSLKDAAILEKALQKDPANSRYVFYLAQSYASAGRFHLALEQYEKRVSMGEGITPMSREEVFWSLYNIGCLQSDLKMPAEIIIDSLLRAFQFDETRAEPLYRLAVQFQLMESHIMGYLLVKYALSLPLPKFFTRIQRPVYDYLLQLKLAEFSYLLGNFEESICAYNRLLEVHHLPEDTRKMVEGNLAEFKKANVVL